MKTVEIILYKLGYAIGRVFVYYPMKLRNEWLEEKKYKQKQI